MNKIVEQIKRDWSLIPYARSAYSSRIDNLIFYIAYYQLDSLFYDICFPIPLGEYECNGSFILDK